MKECTCYLWSFDGCGQWSRSRWPSWGTSVNEGSTPQMQNGEMIAWTCTQGNCRRSIEMRVICEECIFEKLGKALSIPHAIVRKLGWRNRINLGSKTLTKMKYPQRPCNSPTGPVGVLWAVYRGSSSWCPNCQYHIGEAEDASQRPFSNRERVQPHLPKILGPLR